MESADIVLLVALSMTLLSFFMINKERIKRVIRSLLKFINKIQK